MDLSIKTLSQLETILKEWGYPKYRAAQVYDWVHKKLIIDARLMKNLPGQLRFQLDDCFKSLALPIADKRISADKKSVKYLFRLSDGEYIESVLMRQSYGNSLCVSSQVGCRMGCAFCASTVNGLIRDLSASEILGQVYSISRDISQLSFERIRSVVIMGIGEPLDNYENVISFIKQVTNEDGFNLSGRSITISTCGMSEKVIQLAKEGLSVTLALSLHSGVQEIREALMPIAKSEPFDRVMPAVNSYFEITGRRVTLEYALINGVNDSANDAYQLCALYDKYLKNSGAHINLIYVNRVLGKDFKPSDKKTAQKFEKILLRHQINVTVRKSLGKDIDGACGQLRAKRI